jgi:hypothetical protein
LPGLALDRCSLVCRPGLQGALQCMCGNTMSVPLLTDAATVSGAERETAAVRACPLLAASGPDPGGGVGNGEVAVMRREFPEARRLRVGNLLAPTSVPPGPLDWGRGGLKWGGQEGDELSKGHLPTSPLVTFSRLFFYMDLETQGE